MDTLRAGIVGMGYMGDRYARVLRRSAPAHLVGVCDSVAERAEAAGRAFDVPSYTTVEELLTHQPVQVLFVCGPEDAHVLPCLAALERGIAVLVEKPLATTVADGERICAAARAHSAVLSVGHLLRFDTRYALAKEAVDAGRLGAVQSLHARRWNGRDAQVRLQGRCSLPLFLGVHDYDLVRWFAGAEPVRVYAESRRTLLAAQGFAVEDTSIALISFANGALACVEEGWIMPRGHPGGFEQRLDVLGERGMVTVAGSPSGLTVMDDERAQWPDTALWPAIEEGGVGGTLALELASFLNAVATGRPPLVSGEDGLAAVRMAKAVEQSAATGLPVELPAPGAHA
jgi:UDP-N-acetylglucosamine 3-dehydrogenase